MSRLKLKVQKSVLNLTNKLNKFRRKFSIKSDEIIIYGVYINLVCGNYRVITESSRTKLDIDLRFWVKQNSFEKFNLGPNRYKLIISKTPVGNNFSKVNFAEYALNKNYTEKGSSYFTIQANISTNEYEEGMLVQGGSIIFITKEERLVRNINASIDFSRVYYISFVEL